jgi:hypothetical protein
MGLNLAGYNFKWYEDLPTPWDFDCRGKFVILKTTHPLDRGSSVEEKYEFFKRIGKTLEESGKMNFLKENEVNLNTMRITGVINQASYQLNVAVVVDLPRELRTMYALRFTE